MARIKRVGSPDDHLLLRSGHRAFDPRRPGRGEIVMFGKHWTPAQGTVVASHVVKTAGDGLVTVSEYVVEVRTDQGETFRAKVQEPHIAMNFASPAVGAVVRVEFDPKSHSVRFDKDDPAVNRKAAMKNRDDGFDRALAEAPGTAPAPGDTAGPLAALLAAQGDNAIRLGAQNLDTAALRQMLLRATAAGGPPPVADPATGDAVHE
jgi:hypothetical protein